MNVKILYLQHKIILAFFTSLSSLCSRLIGYRLSAVADAESPIALCFVRLQFVSWKTADEDFVHETNSMTRLGLGDDSVVVDQELLSPWRDLE